MAKSNRELLHDTFVEEVMKMNKKRRPKEMFENHSKLSKDGKVYMKEGSGGLVRAAQKKSISDESITKKDTKNKFNRDRGRTVEGYSALVIADNVARYVLGGLGYEQANPKEALKHLNEILDDVVEADVKNPIDYKRKYDDLVKKLAKPIEECIRKYSKVDWLGSRRGY